MQQQVKRTDRDQEQDEVMDLPTEAAAKDVDHSATDALLDEIDQLLDEATVNEVDAARQEYREKLKSLSFVVSRSEEPEMSEVAVAIGEATVLGCDGSGACVLCTSSC